MGFHLGPGKLERVFFWDEVLARLFHPTLPPMDLLTQTTIAEGP